MDSRDARAVGSWFVQFGPPSHYFQGCIVELSKRYGYG